MPTKTPYVASLVRQATRPGEDLGGPKTRLARSKTTTLLLVCLTAVSVAARTSAGPLESPHSPASNRAAPAEIGAFTELTLTLSTDREEYLPFEPMEVTVAVRNNTRRTVMGHSSMNRDTGAGYLTFLICRQGEEFRPFKSLNCMGILEGAGGEPVPVAPGGTSRHAEILS